MLHHVLATYRYGVSVAALFAGTAAANVGGAVLTSGEADAWAVDFTYHTDVTKQASLIDSGTPANNYDAAPFTKLTYTSPSLKLCRQADGIYRYGNHNVCLQSQTLATTWTNGAVVITSNTTAAPDNSVTADTLTPSAANVEHYIQQTVSNPAGRNNQASVYAKPNGYDYIAISIYDGSHHKAWFNITTGALGTVEAGVTASIVAAANGFYKCTMRYTVAAASGNNILTCFVTSTDNLTSFVGDTVKGAFLWGAEFKNYPVEEGVLTAGYLVTTTTAKFNLPYEWNAALASQGILIEEARTNVIQRSQNFSAVWTLSAVTNSIAATAPDGTSTGNTWTMTGAGVSVHAYQSTSVGSTITATYSVFAKQGTTQYLALRTLVSANNWAAAVFDLGGGGTTATQTGVGVTSGTMGTTKMEDAGNGWFRCSAVMTVTGASPLFVIQLAGAATGNTFQTDGGILLSPSSQTLVFWNAQCEVGSFATSPIQTVSATVMRVVDAITLATSAFPWSRATGTFVAWGQTKAASGTQDLTSTITFTTRLATDSHTVAASGAADTMVRFPSHPGANTLFKDAIGWQVNDARNCRNGTLLGGADDNTVDVTTGSDTTALVFGGANALNGYLTQVTFLKRRATNGELQTRTT